MKCASYNTVLHLQLAEEESNKEAWNFLKTVYFMSDCIAPQTQGGKVTDNPASLEGTNPGPIVLLEGREEPRPRSLIQQGVFADEVTFLQVRGCHSAGVLLHQPGLSQLRLPEPSVNRAGC